MDAVDTNTQEITAGEPRVNQPPPDILNIIQSSPEVTDSIKKLADAPIETVLNHAYNLTG